MMGTPHFDEAVRVDWHDGTITDLVIHRDAAGEAYIYHSPLDETKTLVCSICNSGARVYIAE